MKNVYLIGMMGSGKTSTGKELAHLLGLSFVDLDSLIEDRAGKSINEIFASDGEPYFRRLESEVLVQTARKSAAQVVATGGGAVLDPRNCEKMKETGTVIYLKTSLEVLWPRVQSVSDRPLLLAANPKESLARIFRIRTPIYLETADRTYVTDGLTPEAVALEIFRSCFKGK